MTDIQVLIADDHPIVCKGLIDLLSSASGITVVGEANTGRQALDLIQRLQPDVALLDIEMPELTGIEVMKIIHEDNVCVRILGLSSYDDLEYISEIISLGAYGYLIKDEAPELIVEAIRGVARGEKGWFSRKVSGKLGQLIEMEKMPGQDLTIRERDVLRLLVEGRTNSDIGQNLGISEKTVEKHVDGIFKKMQVTSRVEAAVMAIRYNFV